MLKPIIYRSLLLIISLILSVSANATGLISVTDLLEKQSDKNVIVLEMQPIQYYQKAHIPNSVHTDYAKWRLTDSNGLGKMLPGNTNLSSLIGELGIGNQSEVIIVPIGRGAGDMAAAARIYWTLYVAGLDNISILDGGIIAYINHVGQDGDYESGYSKPETNKFVVNLRNDEIMTQDKVAAFIDQQQSIVDARSPEEFVGLVAGAANERPGAMPTAVNLPYDSLMNQKQDGLLEIAELRRLFESAGAPLDGPQVSYCHTGHRTSLVWFVSHELLGNTQARLYDGSTLEWSATDDRPLVVKTEK